MIEVVKFIHVSAVILSYALFFIRGLWMIQESLSLRQRWVRIVPHVVDTLLLAAGVTLVVLTGQYPLVDNWLTAKLAGVIVYIGLGFIALRFGRRRRTRIAAWIGAQTAFFYVVAVAVGRSPIPFAAFIH